MRDGSELAAVVAGKVCHDMFEPLNAMVLNLDLLKSDPAEAGAQLEQSVKKIWAKLDFYRFAVATSHVEADSELAEAREVLTKVFGHMRPQLNWSAPPIAMPRPAVCVAAMLAVVSADCVPRGGVVEVGGAAGEVRIAATGAKALLRPEIAAAILGEVDTAERRSTTILPMFAGVVARQAGLELRVREGEERVEFIALSDRIALRAAA